MRRRLALLAAVALLAAGCGVQEEREQERWQADPAAAAVWEPSGADYNEETLELQRRLAMWYNLNLISQEQDGGFHEAYRSILADTRMIGWVEFPGTGAVPIRHEGCDPGGVFIHSRDSAFPIGGLGNQTVLWLEDWSAGAFGLEKGSVFQIHILDLVLTYRAVSVEAGKPVPEPAAGEDRCVLVFSRDGGMTVVLGLREGE